MGVTCPIMRIHPAVLAQSAATTGELFDGRFTWGVGTGEALNEHITGQRWPIAPHRIEMLEEAIDIIRRLWTGEEVTFRGQHFIVENARMLRHRRPSTDPDRHLGVRSSWPRRWPPAPVMACGPAATPRRSRTWRSAGGTGPVCSQVTLCWAPSRDEAVERAHRIWPNTGVPGQLSQDLPTPAHFEQAASTVTKEIDRRVRSVWTGHECGSSMEFDRPSMPASITCTSIRSGTIRRASARRGRRRSPRRSPV